MKAMGLTAIPQKVVPEGDSGGLPASSGGSKWAHIYRCCRACKHVPSLRGRPYLVEKQLGRSVAAKVWSKALAYFSGTLNRPALSFATNGVPK